MRPDRATFFFSISPEVERIAEGLVRCCPHPRLQQLVGYGDVMDEVICIRVVKQRMTVGVIADVVTCGDPGVEDSRHIGIDVQRPGIGEGEDALDLIARQGVECAVGDRSWGMARRQCKMRIDG